MKRAIGLALLFAVSGCVSTPTIPLTEAVKKQQPVDDWGKQGIAKQYKFSPGYSTSESRISYYVWDGVKLTACVKGVIKSTSGAREVKVAVFTAQQANGLRTISLTHGGNQAVCDLPNLKWEPFPELGYYRKPS